MNVGAYLDEAAESLARGLAALRAGPAATEEERAAVAVARTRMYVQLQRQVAMLGDGGFVSEEQVYEAARVRMPSPEVELRACLWAATSQVRAVLPSRPPRVSSSEPVATALWRAAQAVGIANELLAGNLGAGRSGPPTVEGEAVAAGHGKRDSLAETARLVSYMADLDERLERSQWLCTGDQTRVWRPLLMAASVDVDRACAGGVRAAAIRAGAGGEAGQAPLRTLNPVPMVDDVWRWNRIGTAAEAITAMDAARAWVFRNGRHLTAEQIGQAARSATAIVVHIGYVLDNTGTPIGAVDHAVRRTAQPWRQTAEAAGSFRSSIPAAVDSSTLTTALAGVRRWLVASLRIGDRWQPVEHWAGDRAQATRWRHVAGEIAARLPDLADLLGQGVSETVERGTLLHTSRLEHRPGRLVQMPQWEHLTRSDPAYKELRQILRRAADHSGRLADLAEARRPLGLRQVKAAYRHPGFKSWQVPSARRNFPTKTETPTAGPGSEPWSPETPPLPSTRPHRRSR